MSLEREAFLDVVEDSYSAYYNIIKEGLPQDLPMVFRGDFFQRAEKYWLSKKIPIYGNEMNEYVYVFSADSFDAGTVSKCIQFSMDDGLPRVKPHKEHQYTNIKALFIANEFEEAAIEDVRRRRFQKTYNHSLWGYSNLITVAVDASTEKVWFNAAGRDMKKYFSKLFAAQKKKK